jgi:hypothetical protein
VVTWRLVPEGHGTRLFVVHAGFGPDGSPTAPAFDAMRRGWSDTLPRAPCDELDRLALEPRAV